MIIVTGGAGFIGSNLVAALEERGEGPLAVCDTPGSGGNGRTVAKRKLEAVIEPAARSGCSSPITRNGASPNPRYADGGQCRDFVWVGDCVAVMLWLLDNPQVNGLFNVGTGTARRFSDLGRALFAALGQSPLIEYVEMPESMRAHYQYFTEARMERLRHAGYAAPFTTIEEGVGTYVRDHLSRDDPYR